MQNSQQNANYGSVAKFLHWTISSLIIINFILGITLDATKFRFMDFHKQIGLTILGLVIVRIIWRLCNKYPSMLNTMSLAEKIVAKMGHIVLYALMFGVPFGGVLLVQAHGYPLVFLGFIPFPVIIAPQAHDVSHLIGKMHEYVAWAIIIIAFGHALFALKHHFVNKDRVLLRMLPGHGEQ